MLAVASIPMTVCELRERQCSLSPQLVPEDDRLGAVTIMQQVLGEIEPGVGEPSGSELRIGRSDAVAANQGDVPRADRPDIQRLRPFARRDDVGELRERGPELRGLLHRPLVQ
jgi:hypothetical protein